LIPFLPQKTPERSQTAANQDPLFLAQSPVDINHEADSQDIDYRDEDFPLVFDSVYILPDTPDLTTSTPMSDNSEPKPSSRNLSMDEPRFANTRAEEKTENILNFATMDSEDTTYGFDDLADLEAWLKTDAVVIVD